ncbi:hypothetical protein G3I76_32405, partial [Streptomyces sp. SID11233]|nr:hypothetical protein [Streptomyces sp. SID11233]
HHYYGDAVNITGDHNIGINHGFVVNPAQDPQELRALLALLHEHAAALRDRLPPEDADELDASLAEAGDETATPRARRGALRVLAGIAATAGELAGPLIET